MSDKKNFNSPTAKTVQKPRRPSTVSGASTSRKVPPPPSTIKEKPSKLRNTSILPSEADTTVLKDIPLPEFDREYQEMAYGDFLRAMLEECIVNETIEREETQIDIQMSLLADRFQRTVDVLDKTSRKMKDIKFVVEQERLLDLKSQHSAKFYETTDSYNAQELLQDLSSLEQASLDTLTTKNIEFGYNKETGHKQLLDAVNEAIEGLATIKKQSNLEEKQFLEYKKSSETLDELQRDRFDLESLKSDFEVKFPNLNEKLLQDASRKIARMFDVDVNEDDD